MVRVEKIHDVRQRRGDVGVRKELHIWLADCIPRPLHCLVIFFHLHEGNRPERHDAPHVVEDEVQNGIIVQNLSSCTFYPAASRIDDGVHVVRLAIPVCRLRPEMQGSRRPFDGVGRRRLSVNLVEIGDRRGRARPMNLHVSHNSVETGERCAVFAPGSKLSAHGPAGMVVASSIM